MALSQRRIPQKWPSLHKRWGDVLNRMKNLISNFELLAAKELPIRLKKMWSKVAKFTEDWD